MEASLLALNLYITFYGLVEMCEVEGVGLYWTWIAKMMTVVC